MLHITYIHRQDYIKRWQKADKGMALKKPDRNFTENIEERARLLLETHFHKGKLVTLENLNEEYMGPT